MVAYLQLNHIGDTYILNTWKSGFGNMDIPKPEFRLVEKEIIEKIKALQSISK